MSAINLTQMIESMSPDPRVREILWRAEREDMLVSLLEEQRNACQDKARCPFDHSTPFNVRIFLEELDTLIEREEENYEINAERWPKENGPEGANLDAYIPAIKAIKVELTEANAIAEAMMCLVDCADQLQMNTPFKGKSWQMGERAKKVAKELDRAFPPTSERSAPNA